ncbi:hypothetical protein O3P69_008606 [Scylla paramamosain]|uniref:Uncharacterized protein n=1 Tax=Scylla paramamosain TaxID=85552 RepID=A0AAW0SMJ9_SCYPA
MGEGKRTLCESIIEEVVSRTCGFTCAILRHCQLFLLESCKTFISKLGTKTSNLHGRKNTAAGRWCKLFPSLTSSLCPNK